MAWVGISDAKTKFENFSAIGADDFLREFQLINEPSGLTDKLRQALLNEASERLQGLPWKDDAPGDPHALDRFTAATLRQHEDIELAFYTLLAFRTAAFAFWKSIGTTKQAGSELAYRQSNFSTLEDAEGNNLLIVNPYIADLPYRTQVIINGYVNLPSSSGGAGILGPSTPFDVTRERIGNRLYERQPDGSWKQVAENDQVPDLPNTIIRQRLRGRLYERMADGDYREKVAPTSSGAAPMFDGAAPTPGPGPGPAPDPGSAGVDQVARDGVAANTRRIVSAEGDIDDLERQRSRDNTNIYAAIDAVRGVVTGGTVGQILARIAGSGSPYGWINAPTGEGGGGVDQTARDEASSAQRLATTNASFLSTFTDRVRQVIESVVPSWAREPSPPSGTGSGTGAVADGSITTAKLADNAVTAAKLADDAVTGRKIEAGAVASGHIAGAAVTGTKIARDAVTQDHLAADSVGASELRADAVGTAEIVDGSVSEAKLANDAVTGAKIAADAVAEDKLSADVRTKLNKSGTGGSATVGGLVIDNIVKTTGSDSYNKSTKAVPASGTLAVRLNFGSTSTPRRTPWFFIDVAQLRTYGKRSTSSSFLSDDDGISLVLEEGIIAICSWATDGTVIVSRNAGTVTISELWVGELKGGGGSSSSSSGAGAVSWAEPGNTSVIPKAKIPHYVSAVPSMNPAVIQTTVAGEKDQDLALGYSSSEAGIFRFSRSSNSWVLLAKWQRAATSSSSGPSRTDTELEAFIERIVSSWAISGNADGIPGSKTYDGLFKSEAETGIPGANVDIPFDVGTNADRNEVDETDAGRTTFVISEEQANQAGAYLRVRYDLKRTAAEGDLPRDIELLLQNASTGATITKHNLKDEGAGTAQFAFGDAGAKRWAVRCVTIGRYAGTLTVSETTYHSGKSLADEAIEHVVHPIVSDEAEKRQAEDKRLTSEIIRVEGIKAIVNGLPAPTATTKKFVAFRADRPYQQLDSDAFLVPSSGFVQFIVGNMGVSGIVPVAYCRNREEIIYAVDDVSVGLQFNADGRAALFARKGSARWESHEDAYNTTNGFVMLHWAPARAGGTSESDAGLSAAGVDARIRALVKSWALVGESVPIGVFPGDRAPITVQPRFYSYTDPSIVKDGHGDAFIGIESFDDIINRQNGVAINNSWVDKDSSYWKWGIEIEHNGVVNVRAPQQTQEQKKVTIGGTHNGQLSNSLERVEFSTEVAQGLVVTLRKSRETVSFALPPIRTIQTSLVGSPRENSFYYYGGVPSNSLAVVSFLNGLKNGDSVTATFTLDYTPPA